MSLSVLLFLSIADSDDLVAFSGTEGNTIRSSQLSDFGTFEQSLGFRIEDAVGLSMWLKSESFSDVDFNLVTAVIITTYKVSFLLLIKKVFFLSVSLFIVSLTRTSM